MITLDHANLLLSKGYSLIPTAKDKRPTIAWKKYQTNAPTKEEFASNFHTAHYVGYCTGFDNIEVIDVDLKVFATLSEQEKFWKEYLSFLRDNIDEFDSKFVIYKTLNAGYHIIYKSPLVVGNKKIAKLKGMTEAVIESRGIGGYCVVYDNCVTEKNYTQVQEISDYDREVLWGCSAFYNYVQEPPTHEEPKEYKEAQVKPWNDYNEKTSIFDIIGNDFTIVPSTLTGKYVIKRIGAHSPYSGYVYKNSGCMFLFSTGTIYPHEKLITPFMAYAYKNHNGNFSAAGAAIYGEGFGTRVVKKEINYEPIVTINKEDLEFPLDIFPAKIQGYLLECNDTLNSSVDYMGCSLVWLASTVIGSTMNVRVKTGWDELSTVWIALVGEPGIGKTPSIKNITFPLENINSREIKRYIRQHEKYEAYQSLDKKDKEQSEEIKKPQKTQFIANDITLEALVDLHQESKIGVGVFKDELGGWFKDMNKYRAGSDLEFWLSTWSGASVNLNRLTRKGSFVEKPRIPVLGGIQAPILNSFYTEENKDNGFIDRMLLSFPEMSVPYYNKKEMNEELLQWYNDSIIYFYDDVSKNLAKYDDHGEIIPMTARLSPQAETEWIRIFNEITTIQNDDEENEYMKSMLPKQKSYIPRFALILNTIYCYFNGEDGNIGIISKESILKAERLSKYFIAMAKKIKVNSIESFELKSIQGKNKEKSKKDQYLEMLAANPKVNKKEAAGLLGVSRNMLYKYEKS
jgi:mRNA-degrading endonuclease HigB of HigAB toxin-antitoxin module